MDQSVSVSESPEDKRDSRLQRILCASAVRVDLRGQAIDKVAEASLSATKRGGGEK